MSNNDTIYDKIKDELEPVVKEYVDKVLDELKVTAKEYGKDIAKDYAATLYASYISGDAQTERNLKHLNTQVDQLAMIHRIRIQKQTNEMLKKGLEVAFKVGLKLLKAV